MKKGIFSSWFREIATIIFTQAIQAFLLAVVMSIIISALGKNTGQTDQDGQTAAAGLLAIIALSQFGKIELLVKNIFGVTSGIAGNDVSMAGGKSALTAGKLMAMKGAGRLIDNGKKIASFAKNIKTNKEIGNIKGEIAEAENDAAIGGATKNIESLGRISGTNNGEQTENESLGVSSTDILSALNEQTQAIRQQTAEMQRNRQDDKIKELTEKLDQKNKEKKENIKQGVSGIAESVAGLYGGAAGLSVGLAQGDKMVETTFMGAGAGDVLADKVVNTGSMAIDGIKNINKVNAKSKALGANAANRASQSDNAIAQINKEIEKAQQNKDKNLEKELNSQIENIQKTYNNYYDQMNKGKIISSPSKKGLREAAKKRDISKYDIKHDIGKD